MEFKDALDIVHNSRFLLNGPFNNVNIDTMKRIVVVEQNLENVEKFLVGKVNEENVQKHAEMLKKEEEANTNG